MKKIVLTGGGTSGHVTPNIALLPKLKALGYEISYIGSRNGIEKQLIEKENIPYYSINAGKLRRYIDLKNLTDTIRVMDGFRQAFSILGKVKPNVVFSKGGFVSCPVVWAAWTRRIPVIIHESDITPGLTNKLSMPFSKKVCYTFPECGKLIPEKKGVLTGIPIRSSLLKGDRTKGLKLCGFVENKPVIIIIGGSQGSEKLNGMIREVMPTLLKDFNICHICGNGNARSELEGIPGYKQFQYVNEELAHLFSAADLVVSRAGATTLFELLELRKPNLLIPLSRAASRGDQILNSQSFKKQGFSSVIEEEQLTSKTFLDGVYEVYKNRRKYIEKMNEGRKANAADTIIKLIEQLQKTR